MLHNQAIHLAIGEITFAIETSDLTLTEILSARYHGFSSNALVDMHLSIDTNGEPAAALRNYPDLTRDGALFSFEAGTCQGIIDIQQRRAKLVVSPRRQVEDVDYFLRILTALACFEAGGLLVHGAGIVKSEMAYIFFGHSGSGKTTVSRLSGDCQILSDDLVAVHPRDGAWWIYATPFGRMVQQTGSHIGHKLVAMYRLVKDKTTFLENVSPGLAAAELIGSTPVISSTPGMAGMALKRCEEISENIPIHRLHFLPDASFWSIIN